MTFTLLISLLLQISSLFHFLSPIWFLAINVCYSAHAHEPWRVPSRCGIKTVIQDLPTNQIRELNLAAVLKNTVRYGGSVRWNSKTKLMQTGFPREDVGGSIAKCIPACYVSALRRQHSYCLYTLCSALFV